MAVMGGAFRGRHQDAHIAADQLLGAVAEDALRRPVDRADAAVRVDHDQPVDDGVAKGAQLRFERFLFRRQPGLPRRRLPGQWEISTGRVMVRISERVTPPKIHSRMREWP